MIETPYLLFLGDAPDMLAAKVAIGIRDWRPDNAVGQLRQRRARHRAPQPQQPGVAVAHLLLVGQPLG